jgi:hypothetical protein
MYDKFILTLSDEETIRHDGYPKCWQNYIKFIGQIEDAMIYDLELNLQFVNHTRSMLIEHFLKTDFDAKLLYNKVDDSIPPGKSFIVFERRDNYTLFMLKFG